MDFGSSVILESTSRMIVLRLCGIRMGGVPVMALGTKRGDFKVLWK